MNLDQSISLEALHTPPKAIVPKKRSSIEVAKRVFQLAANGGFPYKYQTPEGWMKKWLSSPEFTLMEIDIHAAASLNINAVASPHPPKNPNRVSHYVNCSIDSLDPIVVDLNKRQVGKSYLGYVPEVIVLDGKHRKMAQLRNGHTKILAWVGAKAAKKLAQYRKVARVVDAASENLFLPPVEPTKIATAYEMYATTTPAIPMNGSNISTMKTSEIKSELKDLMAARATDKLGRIKALTSELLKSRIAACGARSSGSLEEPSASDEHVPTDASDAGPHVEASDRRIWNPHKPQVNAPGTKGWSSETTGVNPAAAAPGSGVGPRLKPNTGASRSEMSRAVFAHKDCKCEGKCKGCKKIKAKGMKSGKHIDKIWEKAGKSIAKVMSDSKKRKEEEEEINAVSPPGFSESTMHKLKKKHGTESAFRIAWSAHNKSKGKKL